MTFQDFYKGKTIFVTGHTGFKGAWLSLWLQSMGSKVIGFSLDPPTNPNLFEVAKIGNNMVSIKGDIRDYKTIKKALKKYNPSIIFHLAAQSLVIDSYSNPMETLSTNIMGTANILEICKELKVPVLVNVTSDKCYRNTESNTRFKESDPLGGNDVYSASKACSEIITNSYIYSFFGSNSLDMPIVGTARAGNVIGGGDWADNRLIPDIFRSLSKNKVIEIRSPDSTRPWQHVLEPLNGYLELAKKLHVGDRNFVGPWNFGPLDRESRSVEFVTKAVCDLWGNNANYKIKNTDYKESVFLNLDSRKSIKHLGWRPKLDIETSLKYTIEWYKEYLLESYSMRDFSLKQIEDYQKI